MCSFAAAVCLLLLLLLLLLLVAVVEVGKTRTENCRAAGWASMQLGMNLRRSPGGGLGLRDSTATSGSQLMGVDGCSVAGVGSW
jgi:hypothetical protein